MQQDDRRTGPLIDDEETATGDVDVGGGHARTS
jgi:hypothetical protein